MTATSAPFTRRAFDAAIVARALTNRAYRQRLLADPKSVYREELGGRIPNIPEEVKIHVLEETGDIVYIVIPHSPAHMTETEALALASHEKTHREPCWGLGDGLE